MNFRFAMLCVCLMLWNCGGSYQPTRDVNEVEGEAMLIGDLNYDDVLHYFPRWEKSHRESGVESAIVDKLAAVEQPTEVVCYLGTWCGDSRAGVPPFMKSIVAADNANIQVKLYGLDRQKDDPEHLGFKNDIQRVPTFLVMRDGQEIGRLIEFPLKDSFAEDLLDLLP